MYLCGLFVNWSFECKFQFLLNLQIHNYVYSFCNKINGEKLALQNNDFWNYTHIFNTNDFTV